MRASRTAGRARQRAARGRKLRAPLRATKTAAKPVRKVVPRAIAVPVQPVLYRFCKSGWAVLVEQQPNQQGTRFVCPFCTQSHRVTGPVRGFRKLRRAQWIKLRRVDE